MSRLPFARSYGPWAIVAGGLEGLGAAFAGEIARRSVHQVLVARRPEPLFVASLAGLQGVPGLAAYSATKAYLISLGESLWAELRPAGVDVLTVCAGAVVTPGYQQATSRQAPGATSPELVAATALRALGHGCRVVPGTVNRVSAFALQRLVPRRTAIAVLGRATAATLKD